MTPLVSIVRRPPRTSPAPEEPVVAIHTGALGYLGASEEDRTRWLAGFRQLLDGLDSPLQVVMRFRPGTGSAPSPSQNAPPRVHDLEFARWLRDRPTAQARSTILVCRKSSAQTVKAALVRIGVSVKDCSGVPDHIEGGLESRTAFAQRDRLHRTYWVDRLPGSELEPGWILRLVPPEAELTIAWHADPLPQGWVVEYLQRQLVQMRAQRLLQDPAGPSDPQLAGALPTAEELQRRLSASQEKAFHLALYLTISVPIASKETLDREAERLEAAARASLCDIRSCDFRMRDGHLATEPALIDRLGRRRVVDSSSLSTLFPWLDADLQSSSGVVVGTSRSTGCPVIIDPFDSSRYANANVGIFGHSGAGKTYLMSTLLMGSLAAGAQVFVIDPEHEYGRLASHLGGVEVPLHLGSGHALNVLGLRPSQPLRDADPERWLGPAVADAVDLMAIICGGLDEPERAVAEAATRATYAEEDEPVMRDVAERLPPDSRPARILTRWVQGSLGAMFSAPTNVDLDADFVVFGMRELREELVAPVHFLLAEGLWSRIKSGGRRRLLVVDELGLLFEDATIRRFVVTLARRIRKYDGALVFATQNPGDLLSTEPGTVVATNPAIHFFGAQRPGEAQKLQRAFHLSDAQRTFLEGARRGEFLLAAGAERLPVNVEASPRQAAILASGRPRPGS